MKISGSGGGSGDNSIDNNSVIAAVLQVAMLQVASVLQVAPMQRLPLGRRRKGTSVKSSWRAPSEAGCSRCSGGLGHRLAQVMPVLLILLRQASWRLA